MGIEQDSYWHLDKRINIGHLLTTLSVATGLVIWGASVESRLSVLHTQYENQQQTQNEIKDQLIRLNDKMDRLLQVYYSDEHS